MSKMQDSFLDIIKHTSKLGFIEMVKLIGENGTTKIEAIENDRVVVVYGTLKEEIDGFNGTVGLARLGILDGYLHFPPFESDNASVSIKDQERNGVSSPLEINFDSNDGHNASYRFMNKVQADEQIQAPPFRGAKWDVVITPTKQNLRDLSYIYSVMSGFEQNFLVKVENGNLEFHVGVGANDRTKLTIATGVTGTLKHGWSWPLSHVLAILKLMDSSKSCTLHISDQGALKIEIDSDIGDYQYILPARTK